MLVELARLESAIAADAARILLESEGLPAILFDQGLASLGMGPLTPVRLMVHEADEDRARTLIASISP